MNISRNGVSANITASKKPGAKVGVGRPVGKIEETRADLGISGRVPVVGIQASSSGRTVVQSGVPRMGIDSGRLSTTIQPTSPFVRIQDSRASWRIDNGVPYMQSKPTVFTPADIFFLLQESGDFLLQETGGYLIR